MPRTKVPNKFKKPEKSAVQVSRKHSENMIDSYLKNLGDDCKVQLVAVNGALQSALVMVDTAYREELLLYGPSILDKTIAELRLAHSSDSSAFDSAYLKNLTMNSTKSVKRTAKKPHNRSSSLVDEGYLTAGSNKGRSGERKSRQLTKLPRVNRVSRSMSRSKIQQSVSSYKTPSNRAISNLSSFATVTPKVKPNTPQVLLRRPNQGEIAISMQGSPLMVSSMVSDQVANVNIPLADGRLLSIQPQRGLRTSDIPTLDPITRRQIETLRDNLNKVCAMIPRR